MSANSNTEVTECDVVVVGLGIAGACAAIEAAEAGRSVIALEGASGAGGSSSQSGGEIYLGGGTSTQQALGVDDSVEAMRDFLRSALGPHADEEKIDLYCSGAVEHHDWLVKHGAVFNHKLWETPTWMPGDDSGLMWMGERGQPYAAQSTPAPRGHRPPEPNFAGGHLMSRILASVDEAGVAVHTDVRARSLIVEDGKIVGVRTTKFGLPHEYRCALGVVLATGGFVDNDEMLVDHAPAALGLGKISAGRDDGSGITMGLQVGAAIRRMAQVETALPVVPRLLAGGLLVDGLGQRFINEDIYPGLYSHKAVHHRPGPIWIIVDEIGVDSVPEGELWGMRPDFVAETIEELAEECGLPAYALSDTVRRYNEHAALGVDPLCGKAVQFLRPLESPFAAYATGHGATVGIRGQKTTAQAFTLGGLRTTVDGEVVDNFGSTIPGLYAAGRCTHGMHGEGYISGTSLGDGSFFGRRAGRAVISDA